MFTYGEILTPNGSDVEFKPQTFSHAWDRASLCTQTQKCSALPPLFLLGVIFKASRPKILGFTAAALVPANPPASVMWRNWGNGAPSPLKCHTGALQNVRKLDIISLYGSQRSQSPAAQLRTPSALQKIHTRRPELRNEHHNSGYSFKKFLLPRNERERKDTSIN